MAKEKKKILVTQPGRPDDKKKALENALAQIEKNHGKGAIMRLGDDIPINVESISTGSLTLDIALGVGGIPKGRIIEIYGPESSGKTTLALHIIASAQAGGGEAAFIDVEHALEPAYAKVLGVDIDNLLISQPDTGEQALDIAESLVRSGALDVVVIDSVAALLPRSEWDDNIGNTGVGVVARLMSQALRKLAGQISKTSCVVIFINQLRSNIGGGPYTPKETTVGGRALKYFASVRIDVRRTEAIKIGSDRVGNHTTARVTKNKVAPPFKEAEFDIIFGEGISKVGEIIDLGELLGLVEKAGAWYTVGTSRLQGRENVKKFLKENPEVALELEAKIKENASKINAPDPKSKSKKKSKKAAGKAIDVDAEDFTDETDDGDTGDSIPDDGDTADSAADDGDPVDSVPDDDDTVDSVPDDDDDIGDGGDDDN